MITLRDSSTALFCPHQPETAKHVVCEYVNLYLCADCARQYADPDRVIECGHEAANRPLFMAGRWWMNCELCEARQNLFIILEREREMGLQFEFPYFAAMLVE